jgi:uroporphyrinogen-III synthase
MTAGLNNVGIVITRPLRQVSGLVQQIACLGGRPIVFPAIVILPPSDRAILERALANLHQYDVAIFVSANAVEYGVGDPARWPESVQVFAPGPGTAAALAGLGLGNVRIPSTTFDSEGLLALDDLAHVDGKRIAVFRGSGGREALVQSLRARGAHVDLVECYTRAKPAGGAGGLVEAWRENRVDAISFTSSEGMRNVWEILDAEGREHLRATPAFVPHPRILEAARELGLSRLVVTAATDAGLIASLLEYFAARSFIPASSAKPTSTHG